MLFGDKQKTRSVIKHSFLLKAGCDKYDFHDGYLIKFDVLSIQTRALLTWFPQLQFSLPNPLGIDTNCPFWHWFINFLSIEQFSSFSCWSNLRFYKLFWYGFFVEHSFCVQKTVWHQSPKVCHRVISAVCYLFYYPTLAEGNFSLTSDNNGKRKINLFSLPRLNVWHSVTGGGKSVPLLPHTWPEWIQQIPSYKLLTENLFCSPLIGRCVCSHYGSEVIFTAMTGALADPREQRMIVVSLWNMVNLANFYSRLRNSSSLGVKGYKNE